MIANGIIDIDDTIKVSEVRDRLALLRHTFAELPEAVPGMPQLYQHIQTALGKPVWFYLSASPYNLYPMLRSFTSDYYPRGQLILREMSWMELESFIVSLTVGTQKYKEERMRTVMKWLPMRKWVLIGDSTQTDPEAYASL
jgi:phosphatidate phosphatase APP1